jgi:XTP/dITP diphosphohydrolase
MKSNAEERDSQAPNSPRTSRRDLLLASHNPGKIREIRRMCANLPFIWHGLDEFLDLPDAVEDAPTFAGNARRKALHYARLTGLVTLADDSGLEVDALTGAPGVRSARFAGSQRDDGANNRKLIALLADVPADRRTARFRCALALARRDDVLLEAEGAVEGRIVDEPRGGGGFGYDPHFWLPSLGCTMAELPPERKNQISHRGEALRELLSRIEAVLRDVDGILGP